MKLDYSFKDIKPCWFSGDLPFPDMRTERVKVRLSGRSSSDFPPCFEIGDLLGYTRHSRQESAVTLLLTYHHSNVPLRTSPPPVGEWYPCPGAPIYGQIRVALSPEAVRQIRAASANDYRYELTLENVELNDVTKRQIAE
jgi:hypothetical protein